MLPLNLEVDKMLFDGPTLTTNWVKIADDIVKATTVKKIKSSIQEGNFHFIKAENYPAKDVVGYIESTYRYPNTKQVANLSVYFCTADEGPCPTYLEYVERYQSPITCDNGCLMCERKSYSAETTSAPGKEAKLQYQAIWLAQRLYGLVSEIGEKNTIKLVNAGLAYIAFYSIAKDFKESLPSSDEEFLNALIESPQTGDTAEAVVKLLSTVPKWVMTETGTRVSEILEFVLRALIYPWYSNHPNIKSNRDTSPLWLWKRLYSITAGTRDDSNFGDIEKKWREAANNLVQDLFWTKTNLSSKTSKDGSTITVVTVWTNNNCIRHTPVINSRLYTDTKSSPRTVEPSAGHLGTSGSHVDTGNSNKLTGLVSSDLVEHLVTKRNYPQVISFNLESSDPGMGAVTEAVADGKVDFSMKNDSHMVDEIFTHGNRLGAYNPRFQLILAETAIRSACKTIVDTGATFMIDLIN